MSSAPDPTAPAQRLGEPGEPDASGRRSPVPIPGSEFVIKADTVIPAVSQAADLTMLPVETTIPARSGRPRSAIVLASHASALSGWPRTIGA